MEELIEFTFSDIKNELFRLKSKEMKTNFFISEIQFNELQKENEIKVFKTEKACFLIIRDDGFSRFYFIISEITALKPMLEFISQNFDGDVSVEIAGNSQYLENVKQFFLSNGFYEYSSMVRMNKMRSETNEINFEGIHLLTEDKKAEIQNIYNKYFDKFVERIPSETEIDHFITNKNAYYFSDNDEIQGFIIFESHGITSHLRYWFVHPSYREKKIGSKLIQIFFNIGDNVKRELFWVIESNENAIKRYKHFGFAEENMHNLILINKDRKYEESNY